MLKKIGGWSVHKDTEEESEVKSSETHSILIIILLKLKGFKLY